MKFRSIILTAVAVAFAFASCQKPAEEIVGAPEVTVNPSELSFDEAAASKTVELKATREWKAEIPAAAREWLTVTPAKGEASNDVQTITIDVKANAGENRDASIKFTIGMDHANLKVAQVGPKGSSEPFFTHDFKNGDGGFVIDDKSKDPALSYVWKFDASHGQAKASTYKDNANYAAESWLVSPEVDLTGTATAFIEFEHTLNFLKEGTITDHIALKVSSDKGANWENVAITTMPDGASWDFVSSGYMDISKYAGKKIKFAFVYTATTACAPTWEVKTVQVVPVAGATPEPEVPGELKQVTVAEFLAAPKGAQRYEITATIKAIVNAEGTMYIGDETGTVFVYKLAADAEGKGTFADLNLQKNDKVTINCVKDIYYDNHQAKGYYVKHEEGTHDPVKQDGDAVKPFTSNVTWTENKETNAYNSTISVNGTSTQAFKLGASKKYGTGVLTIPAGAKKLGFYAVGWKGDVALLQFPNDVQVTVLRGNDGLSGKEPEGGYKLTGISAYDYYEITLNGETSLEVKTVELGKRAVLFGINSSN